jgi:hypothetical protein
MAHVLVDSALPASYSGSDIAVVVRDALMQPVRKVLSATHFKPVQPDPDSAIIKWTPCSPGDPDAVEKNWTQVESDELQEPPLRFTDFVKSLESVRPTVSQEDIRKHDEWTKESGEFHRHANHLLWLTNSVLEVLMVHDNFPEKGSLHAVTTLSPFFIFFSPSFGLLVFH